MTWKRIYIFFPCWSVTEFQFSEISGRVKRSLEQNLASVVKRLSNEKIFLEYSLSSSVFFLFFILRTPPIFIFGFRCHLTNGTFSVQGKKKTLKLPVSVSTVCKGL